MPLKSISVVMRNKTDSQDFFFKQVKDNKVLLFDYFWLNILIFTSLVKLGKLMKTRPLSGLGSCNRLLASWSMLLKLLKHAWIIVGLTWSLIKNMFEACQSLNLAISMNITKTLLWAHLKHSFEEVETYLNPTWSQP